MNFVFTVTAHGFDKAGKVDKALRDLGITSFEVKTKSACGTQKNVGRRKRLTKVEVVAVQSTIDQHPDWGDTEVGRVSGVSSTTVARIRDGSHVLLQ